MECCRSLKDVFQSNLQVDIFHLNRTCMKVISSTVRVAEVDLNWI